MRTDITTPKVAFRNFVNAPYKIDNPTSSYVLCYFLLCLPVHYVWRRVVKHNLSPAVANFRKLSAANSGSVHTFGCRGEQSTVAPNQRLTS
jgi:hypothetical protein